MWQRSGVLTSGGTEVAHSEDPGGAERRPPEGALALVLSWDVGGRVVAGVRRLDMIEALMEARLASFLLRHCAGGSGRCGAMVWSRDA